MLEKYYPHQYASSVFAIDYEKLYRMGYRGLLFDLDNTLVHHGDDATPEVEELFRRLHAMGFKTLVLSNNDEARVLRFLKHIDARYICEADKPRPENYLKGVKMLGVEKREAIFVGDQIFTDILGANRAGITNILVHFIQLPGEKKIGKKRYLEKAILLLWRNSRRAKCGLGDISLPQKRCVTGMERGEGDA